MPTPQPLSLDGLHFDARYTSVREAYEEVGGRDARTVHIEGVLQDSDADALEAALGAIMAAASDVHTVPLVLRPGRVLHVRRLAFRRERPRRGHTAFRLDLEAPDPCEYANAETETPWAIAATGDLVGLTPAGNVWTPARVALFANGDLVAPAIGDGARTATYTETVPAGSLLTFDGATGRVTLDDEDVTPYVTGELPRIGPGPSTLTYTGDAASSHDATGSVAYTDRWW